MVDAGGHIHNHDDEVPKSGDDMLDAFPNWSYSPHHHRGRRWTYHGHVHYVGGVGADLVRLKISAAMRDLLVWAAELSPEDGEHDDGTSTR